MRGNKTTNHNNGEKSVNKSALTVHTDVGNVDYSKDPTVNMLNDAKRWHYKGADGHSQYTNANVKINQF